MKEPNFFIIGSGKSGTTFLYNYLKDHPEVYMSPIKEPHYFCKDLFLEARASGYGGNVTLEGKALKKYLKGKKKKEIHGALINEWEDYLQLYQNVTEETAIGEASPSYLTSKVAAKEINAKVPHALLVAILRNPINRAYSHYLMNLRTNHIRMDCTFIEAVKKYPYLINEGMYYEGLRRYADIFKPDNLKIFLTEDLRNNPKNLFLDLYKFLKIGVLFPEALKHHNNAAVPRFTVFNKLLTRYVSLNRLLKGTLSSYTPEIGRQMLRRLFFTDANLPRLSSGERAYLSEIYQKDIEKLSSLVGRDLSFWLCNSSSESHLY